MIRIKHSAIILRKIKYTINRNVNNYLELKISKNLEIPKSEISKNIQDYIITS